MIHKQIVVTLIAALSLSALLHPADGTATDNPIIETTTAGKILKSIKLGDVSGALTPNDDYGYGLCTYDLVHYNTASLEQAALLAASNGETKAGLTLRGVIDLITKYTKHIKQDQKNQTREIIASCTVTAIVAGLATLIIRNLLVPSGNSSLRKR